MLYTMAATVLIIEDEQDVSDLVQYHVKKAGFSVLTAATAPDGLSMARKYRPELIILDLMLPGGNGVEICRALRADESTAHIGIVMLTAKAETHSCEEGLEVGADDYLTKPFSPRELILRTQAVLRRLTTREKNPVTTVGEFELDLSNFSLSVAGAKVDLTTIEFKLINLLIERRGKVQSRDTLLAEVWGYKNFMDTRTVDTHIRRLRDKLGAKSSRIETIRGEGYLFTA